MFRRAFGGTRAEIIVKIDARLGGNIFRNRPSLLEAERCRQKNLEKNFRSEHFFGRTTSSDVAARGAQALDDLRLGRAGRAIADHINRLLAYAGPPSR